MSPLASTRVIHPHWSQHHQPTAQGAMTATCQIGGESSGEGTWDPVNKVMIPDVADPVYDGRCRVQADFRPSPVTEADQDTADRRYLVAVPAGTLGIQERMTVVITASPKAPQTAGTSLTILAVEHNNEAFELDLSCIEVSFQ